MAEPAENRTHEGREGEVLVNLNQVETGPADVAAGTTERVESLIRGLEEAMSGDWPTLDELRRLPPEDFGNLARQLSLVMDRLSTLRIDLLGAGARCNARF